MLQLLLLSLLLLISIPAHAATRLQDEGVDQGYIWSINCVGSGVACTHSNAEGTLTVSGGSGSPAGSDTQVQFNDGGAFGADAGLTYNKTADILTLTTSTTSATLTDFTQSLTNAGHRISTGYTLDTYTPGIFWDTPGNNATKPKSGIFTKVGSDGTRVYIGTSAAYATGITNTAIIKPYGGLEVYSETQTAADRGLTVGQHNNGIGAAVINFNKSRGSYTSQLAVQENDVIGGFSGRAYSGTQYLTDNALFGFSVTGAVTTTSTPTSFYVNVGSTGSNYNTDLIVHHAGNTGIGDFGSLLTGITAPSGQIHVKAKSSSTIGAVIQAAASQSANLTEWQNSSGTPLTVIDEIGSGGFGTSNPDRLLHAEASDAVTNAVTYPLRLTHISSGTVANSFGAGAEYELENASNTNRVSATEEVTYSDATDATEDATYTLKLIRAGSLTSAFTVNSLCAGTLTDLTVNAEVYDATGWNADTTVPTKDDVRDKLEAMPQTAGRSLTLTGTTVDADAELYTDAKCITVDPAHTVTDWLMWRAPHAVTITGVDCLSANGTSVVMTPRECDSNGANCVDIEAALTCTTSNTTEASGVDNNSIDAGDYIRVTRGTNTGSSTQVQLCLEYTKND